ncbi:MAG: hypothetical protein GW823_00245, partial [Bacteroidetes bacterium]|nr:hypothetical protein [Bacteroidota bacterium]
EGLFNSGTSSISSYNPETKEIVQNVFKNANNTAVIGDILQSAKEIDGELYLVVNNSHKIMVVDPTTLVLKRSLIMPESASPRYVEKGNDNEILVTDIFGNSVNRLNKTSGEVVGQIALGTTSEELIRVGTKVFVANPGPYLNSANTISVIEISNNSVSKIETEGVNIVSIKVDNSGMVWAVATGNYVDKTGKIIIIDSENLSIVKTIDVGGSPSELDINNSTNEVFVLNSPTIQVIDLKTYIIKQTSLVIGSFYTLSVDENDKKLYLTDPKDYTSNGILKVYSLSGDSLDQVTVGVNPGFIHIAN